MHLLFGAAIGSAVKNIPLAIILAFLGHYFLDFFPHIEYTIENIKEKQWRKKIIPILKILLDLCFGVLLILILSKNQPIIYLCAFLSILPDGFTVLNYILPNKILSIHSTIHQEKIHFLKNKKISIFWRISSQLLFIIFSAFLLQFK